MFATHTVLYLGFSFTDAYLNELRSEILALLDYRGGDAPIAYALVNDVPPEQVEFMREHEGICILTYDTRGGRDYSGFDRWLEALHEAASPLRRLGRLLAGKRLLWLDPQPANNDYGLDFLKEAAGEDGCAIDTVATWREAIEALSRANASPASGASRSDAGLASRADASGARYDLVITHWGHCQAQGDDDRPCAAAERLMLEIRRRDLRVPVIVFASPEHVDENRRVALGLGARAFVFGWSTLFQEIEAVLA